MKNHFIPCFYTRRWAQVDGKLTRYSRPFGALIVRRKHPAAVGYEIDLYTLPGIQDEMKYMLEKIYFKGLDQHASDVLDKIEAGEIERLTIENRQWWTLFLISLRQRNAEKMADIACTAEKYFSRI